MLRISPRIRQSRHLDRGSPRELSLWRRFGRTKNPAVREQLVLVYTPLVTGIAGRVARRLPPHVDRQDLVSSGMIGLLAAVDGYDPERANEFSAYAAPRIFGAMIDWLRKTDSLTRTARQQGDDVQVLSLDQSVQTAASDPEQRPSLAETIVDDHVPDPQESVVDQETVRTALGALPPREREVVVLHHFADLSMAVLADLAGVTPRRISAIHSKAIAHLEQALSDAPEPELEEVCRASGSGNGSANTEADALTPPELEVLRAAAEGMSAEETAERLTKSPGTIRTQRKSVREKLRARNMAQAVYLACKQGYLRPVA